MLRTIIPAKIASISAGQLHRLYRALPGKRLLGAAAGIRPTRDAAHFQRMYDAHPDPWHFRTSEYEQAKYRRTLETLPARRFRSAFEVGCSIGVLTQQLALRCDALLGVDIVEQPLVAARGACADQPWVRFRQMKVPDEWPDEIFDLITLSEVLYFLSSKTVVAVADRVCSSLDSTGLVLLVNWRGRSGDPCTGDEAARLFIKRTAAELQPQVQIQEDRYRLDLLGRR
jgi:SAM-dependent methyltransferase